MTFSSSIGAARAQFRGAMGGSTLLRGSVGALFVQVIGAALALLAHLILARMLGVEEYGNYALTLTWISVLSVFALSGQDTSVVRFLPAYLHHREWGKVRGLLHGTALMVLISSALMSALVVVMVLSLQSHLSKPLVACVLAGVALLPIISQLQLNGALHRGLKRAISSGIFNAVIRPLLLIGAVLGLVYLFDYRITGPTAMLLSALAALVAYAASAHVLKAVWPNPARTAARQYEFRSWLSVGSRLFLIAAIGITMRRVDVLLLGGLSGSTSVGPYFAAVQLASVGAYGLTSVNTILAPMIAQYYAAGEPHLLGHVVHRGAQLAFAVTVCASLMLVLFGRWVLGLFGADFVAAYVPLLIILAGQCLNAAVGSAGYLLTMTRFERQAAFIFGAGAALNVILGLLLIPVLGLLGAALATTTATVVWNIAAVVYVRIHLKLNPTIFRLPT